METEQQLLNDIKGGERAALRRLYDRYAPLAMATALRYVGDHDEASDVVQDSFIRILTAVARFDYRGEGSLRAWVTSIVVHQAIDHVKQKERAKLLTLSAEGTAALADPAGAEPPDDEPDVGRVPAAVLNRLIGQLPTGYRMVLNLYVFERMSHKEIARLLGIKAETSASQYSRAKQTLARMIGNYIKNNKL